MKKALFLLALLGAVCFFCNDLSFGHGGQYRGPGDTVPPNLGGPGDSTPPGNQGGPTTPGPSGPSTSGPRGPATPGGAAGPSGPRGASTGGMGRKRYSGGMGYERWEFWWENNKDAFLDLKNRLGGSANVSGSSGFLTGRGRKDTARTSKRPSRNMIKSDVLPALLEALNADHPDILDSAVLSVARITMAEDASLVLDSIRGLLSSNHETAQQSACLSLGVLGSPEACDTCYQLMIDSSEGRKLVGGGKVPNLQRAFAALSLGLIGSEQYAPKLRLIIEKEDEKTQKDLIGCAIIALGLMNNIDAKEENVRFLIKQFENSKMDPFLKASIPVALAKLGNPVALSPMVKSFKEKKLNNWIRQSCAIAMGQLATIEEEEVINLLMTYAKEGKDQMTRHFSFIAMAQIATRDDNYEAHIAQHKKITEFYLRELSRPSKTQHDSWAAVAGSIHAMKHDVLAGPMINKIREKFSDTKDPSAKGALSVSLGLLNAVAAAEMLFEELNDTKNKALQGHLCIGLGLMSWQKAAEKIRDFAANEIVFRLRLQAATALGLMGDTEAVNVLVKALESGQTLSVTSSAAKALGLIGDQSAIVPLRDILQDTKANNLARAFSAVALGIIGEKTDLPWNAVVSENFNYRAKVEAVSEVLDIL
jgi:HEAT repeat protein